jgi:hypothetical protein
VVVGITHITKNLREEVTDKRETSQGM